ncbi:putative methyltransferase-domain-containing protein [Cantharellus anzutake]|uniref:putative methyltransferase-domain-containing protein n=1 Tax=Cantharellus anzutake TaxID=1750568 RepID=UPI0019046B04|nr:putative methyltransferase-domain-containing protein [Cantharellus anzutake]KAF8339572.1 putative methyltransferase-domain-containing protein [Cantharellus anzutake]
MLVVAKTARFQIDIRSPSDPASLGPAKAQPGGAKGFDFLMRLVNMDTGTGGSSVHQIYNFPRGISISKTLSRWPSDFENQRHNEDDIKVYQDIHEDEMGGVEEDIDGYGIAGKLWEAAIDLGTYMRPSSKVEMDPPCSFTSRNEKSSRTVLELGAGTGAAGLFAAANMDSETGDLVILTDLEEVVPLLKKNMQFDLDRRKTKGLKRAEVWARAVPWGDKASWEGLRDELGVSLVGPEGGREVTHILCSDVVYFPALLAPLLRTLIWITEDFKGAEILISCRIREMAKEAPFWHAFGAWFAFEPVIWRSTDSNIGDGVWKRFGAQDETRIFVGHRRAETLGRNNKIGNMSDIDLLTTWRHESFEMILLMEMEAD